MAFNAASFYSVADEMRMKSNADGAHLRTMISRAYYGALIVARDARQISTRGQQGSHQQVINAFAGNNSSDSLVADSLRSLRKLREKADYEPNVPLTRQDGINALAASKRVLHTLGAYPIKP